ncbi:ankyrin repeat domain-containing protein [Luteimonas sp. M1R5S18]|uniref:Ankyrin repeat domain-containing protein n=1 Tax=Luteimonas rhizosphaericola TaxID=3042024 RepID=A0ABT6JNU7_9GAMM|nr:ankyrin repeat domain-containing protein [Luteimonas rhizosphaericola]MDH5831621.1 ankyrin repeat domain-containing protein [Luteimonas rhizosphaericola]
MPEAPASRRQALVAAASAVALTLAAGLGGVVAIAAGVLAQPALALAVRGWRQRRDSDRPTLLRDARALLALWAVAATLVGALVAWPLSAVVDGAGLGPVLALSAASGLCVLALWRSWPLWHALERDGGALSRQWNALGDRDASGWHGLAAAACVAAILGAIVVLAWPGLLPSAARWAMAGASVLAWPGLHLLLQRLPAPPALALPVVDMAGEPSRIDPPAFEGDLDRALYAAARGGRVEQALALLDAGADAHALPLDQDRDQRPLPVLAAVLPDLRLLRALIAAGVDVNAAHAGLTPLLAATRDSWHGRPDAVMTLLANGADPRAADRDGNTPLHHAARSSDPGVAALLRDASAELDVQNTDGLTPLGVACAAGNWRLARFLLERGARPGVESGTPALVAAAAGDEDDPAGVQLLLRHKAKVDARDRDGRTALHVAAFQGHADIVAALLDAGADVQARDAAGATPLLEAARGARMATFEALLAAKADPRAVDHEGRHALLLACLAEAPSSALVARLIELGLDPRSADGAGRRAVDVAAAAGRWRLVALLDPAYALPPSVQAEGGEAAPEDRAPLALLREGLDAGRFDDLDRIAALVTPAELASLLLDDTPAPSIARIDWLVGQGADVEARDADGDTALFRLLARGPAAVPALQALLRHGASPAGGGGLARFLAACVAGDQAGRALELCALELLEAGADPFASSPAGDPPLSLAVHLGWDRLIERLLAIGVDADARDARGMTALHLAAALAREDVLKTLVRHGATIDMRAQDGQTPLGVALASGRRDLADWLDWRGWPLPRRVLQPADLPAAAMAGDADAVRRLIDLGLPVEAVDGQGCTALLRACGGGHPAVVDLLLARGAQPQHVAHTGATPLSAAVSVRQIEIVDRLLAAGAQLEQRLPGEVTVLMLAAALGLPELCARLMTAGANVHATDAQGLTPLHCAALYGFTARDRTRLVALFDTLLLAGAEVDAPAAGGVTPLLLLVGARAEPGSACDEDVLLAVIEHLLDEGASLDARDPRGFGPLHLAALHGLLRLTQRLLRAGADPEARDALNRTPREIAVMRGFVDVAHEYVPVQAGVSMARFLRDRG